MQPILQRQIPYDISQAHPLPGVRPLDWADWLQVDECYSPQLALKATLLEAHFDEVCAAEPGADSEAAQRELLHLVLDQLRARPDFEVSEAQVRRPDGVQVALDETPPLVLLSRLVQEDFCILHKRGAEHVLTAALLCFPSSWHMRSKLSQPLGAIHVPVGSYDDNIQKRVQRLFDGIRAERPLWRFNRLWYSDPALYQPVSDEATRSEDERRAQPYFRSERQSMVKLPQSGAVVFSIRSYVLRRADAVRAGVLLA